MADEGGQERLHAPTEERLKEAARQGNLAYSKEVVTAAAFASALAYIFIRHGAIRAAMEDCLRDFLAFSRRMSVDESSIAPLFMDALVHFAGIAGPIVVAAMAGGLLANVIQTQFNWASRKSFFDPSRLDLARG